MSIAVSVFSLLLAVGVGAVWACGAGRLVTVGVDTPYHSLVLVSSRGTFYLLRMTLDYGLSSPQLEDAPARSPEQGWHLTHEASDSDEAFDWVIHDETAWPGWLGSWGFRHGCPPMYYSESWPFAEGWEIILPNWVLLLLFAILPARAALRFARDRRREMAGLCPRCRYDLRATPDRCPECGEIPATNGNESTSSRG